jgi:hypothetical protein
MEVVTVKPKRPAKLSRVGPHGSGSGTSLADPLHEAFGVLGEALEVGEQHELVLRRTYTGDAGACAAVAAEAAAAPRRLSLVVWGEGGMAGSSFVGNAPLHSSKMDWNSEAGVAATGDAVVAVHAAPSCPCSWQPQRLCMAELQQASRRAVSFTPLRRH